MDLCPELVVLVELDAELVESRLVILGVRLNADRL